MKPPLCTSCKHTMKGHQKKLCLQHQTISLSIGSKYIGTTYNGYPSGKGRLVIDGKLTYFGSFVAGKKHGFGIQHGQQYYKGHWANDKFHGQGELQTSEFIYTGGFRRGKYHGKGCHFWNDSHFYKGQWANNRKHGHGIFVRPQGIYEGNYHCNLKHGLGVWTDRMGNVYNGEWRSGNRHGKGIYTSEDGTYSGSWQYNKEHGQGTWVSKTHGFYIGGWKRGQRHRKGQHTYLDGSVYTGVWEAGQRTGSGTVIYTNGTKYLGFWLKDEYNGRGTLTENDVTYVGEWLAGEREGVFVEKGVNYTSEGSWVCDLRHGTFLVKRGDAQVKELYLWGRCHQMTLAQARRVVRKTLKKKDYLAAEEIFHFWPTLKKWHLFRKYDTDGNLLHLLDTNLALHKFQKHAYSLFQKKRYTFIERLYNTCTHTDTDSLLLDCITHDFVANPWVVRDQGYSQQTKNKLLEGLHLGEFGRCPPLNPFTRQRLEESSGTWLEEDPSRARQTYQLLTTSMRKKASGVAVILDTNDWEKMLQTARDANDRDSIKRIMTERKNFIHSHSRQV